MSVAPGSLVPAWDRLAPHEGASLRVEPLRRVTLDELVVDDDDLPQLDGATLFWAWAEADGWAVRAVLLHDGIATPYAARASRLRLQRPDPNLALLLGIDPADPPRTVSFAGEPRPMETPPRHLACICRLTPSEDVYAALEEGWRTVDEVKRATEACFGECQGRRCVPGIAHRLDLTPEEPRGRITPRPPLVPVPASVLAAFVDGSPRG